MNDKKALSLYLKKMIEFCEGYPAFSIPAAMMADRTGGIKLYDVYTNLSVVKKDEYERGKGNKGSLGSEEWDDTQRSLKKGGGHSIFSFLDENEDEESKSMAKEKEVSEINEEKENRKPWKWYLSAPGGGKTTLLKMHSLAYAYQLYIKKCGKSKELGEGEKIERIETICETLKISEARCPIFIKVRDLQEENYLDISSAQGFEQVIVDAISNIVERQDFNAWNFYKNIEELVLIIDGVEEFANIEFRQAFLNGLADYTGNTEIQCYLSSRYKEYNESGIESNEVSSEEWVIAELSCTDPIVREFAEKWYAALGKENERKKLDVEKDFLKPLTASSEVVNLVSNPLELTSLLMISSFDSCLPSDHAKIYGRSIELWLSFYNQERKNIEDMMRQLAPVAYNMAMSEDNKITIKHATLREYIKQARKDMKRYYQQEWKDDNDSIDEFIQYLCRSHLINRTVDEYEFVHRQYQAYLVSYCIKNNYFSRETRKEKRFAYIEEHIEEKDDFWDQIIIMTAMLDIALRDDIIDKLLQISDDRQTDTNYFVSMLIQLAIIPGINLDEKEQEALFKLLVENEQRWLLFDKKKLDIRKLFKLNEEEDNNLFIEITTRKHAELSEEGKEKFRDEIAPIIFYCIWNCSVGELYIEKALKCFFDNFISTDIIRMIYFAKTEGVDHSNVEKSVMKIVQENIHQDKAEDLSMLGAVIQGYKGSGTPYQRLDELLEENTAESQMLAINILEIAAWLLKNGMATRFGYGIEFSNLTKYSEWIERGILDIENKKMRRDYLLAGIDMLSIKTVSKFGDVWYSKNVFACCTKNVMKEYLEKNSTIEDLVKIRDFEYIALYPCEYESVFKEIICDMQINVQEFGEKVKEHFDNSKTLKGKIYALKLMIFVEALDKQNWLSFVNHMEKTENNFKRRLEDDDIKITYQQIKNQIEKFVGRSQHGTSSKFSGEYDTHTDVMDEFERQKLIARIDEKIAELSLESAEEHMKGTSEYNQEISDALKHYNLALEEYKALYAARQDDEYSNDIERIQNKIALIEKQES